MGLSGWRLSLSGAFLGFVLPVSSIEATDRNALDCSIFNRDSYAEHAARIESGFETVEKVREIIRTQRADEIRQYIEDNIDRRMQQHRGRADQEYWRNTEIWNLCNWEAQRMFEGLVLKHGAASLNETDRAILKVVYPRLQADNNLQPLAALWRFQSRLNCSGTYADAIAMRSREFETAYNQSKCPLRFAN